MNSFMGRSPLSPTCVSYVHVLKKQHVRNLAPHSQKCAFIGYPDEYLG
jgi:hypothetical protein